MFLGSVPAATYGAVEYMEKEILTNCFPIQQTDFIFFPCIAGQDVNLNVLKTSLKYWNKNKKYFKNLLSYESKYKCFPWKGELEGLARTQV